MALTSASFAPAGRSWGGGGGGSWAVLDPFSWDPFPSSDFFSDWPFQLLQARTSGPSRQVARDASAAANTQVDWKETPEAHIFHVDLPGLRREDIKVRVDDGRVLSISGERGEEEQRQEGDTWHRAERTHGRFQRRFRLPENSKPEEMTARVENGVLTIIVPKPQQPKPSVVEVPIASSD